MPMRPRPAYAKDLSVEGSLNFVATTSGAAFPTSANQTMQIGAGTLPVTSASLTVDGSSIVLAFAGTLPSNASVGAGEAAISLLCAK
jgi:hypothetical protein